MLLGAVGQIAAEGAELAALRRDGLVGRRQSLSAVHRQLRDPHCHLSIGELAFRWGFNDQAQFTRAFRQQYG